jgi:regulatory associated protein of mTOR
MRDPNLAMDNREPGRASGARNSPRDRTQPQIQGYENNMNGAAHSESETQDPAGPGIGPTDLGLRPRHNGLGNMRPKTSVAPEGSTMEQLYQTQLGGDKNGTEDNPVAQALNLGRPAAPLLRAKSDFGPRAKGENGSDDEDWKMRHGWEDEFTSHEYLSLLNSASVPVNDLRVSY